MSEEEKAFDKWIKCVWGENCLNVQSLMGMTSRTREKSMRDRLLIAFNAGLAGEKIERARFREAVMSLDTQLDK